jgi:hypothetical protein
VRNDCRRYAALCGQNQASVARWPGRPGRPTTVKPQLTPKARWSLLLPKPVGDIRYRGVQSSDLGGGVCQRPLSSVAGPGDSYSLGNSVPTATR